MSKKYRILKLSIVSIGLTFSLFIGLLSIYYCEYIPDYFEGKALPFFYGVITLIVQLRVVKFAHAYIEKLQGDSITGHNPLCNPPVSELHSASDNNVDGKLSDWRAYLPAFIIITFCVLGAAAAVVVNWFPIPLIKSVLFISLYAVLTFLLIIDLFLMLLPRFYTVLLFVMGFLMRIYSAQSNDDVTVLFEDLISALLCFILAYGLRQYYAVKNGKESFGMGDVLLIAGAGIWFRFDYACLVLFMASISCVVIWTVTKTGKDRYIPYGPFLCYSMVIVSMIPGSIL